MKYEKYLDIFTGEGKTNKGCWVASSGRCDSMCSDNDGCWGGNSKYCTCYCKKSGLQDRCCSGNANCCIGGTNICIS